MNYKLFHQTYIMNSNTPEQQVELNKALIKVLAETTDIVADSTNPFHKNKYASLSAHLNALKPLFAKHGLGILQMPIGDLECVGVRTIIIHKDGGSVSSDALVPAEKGISGQNAGSLYSYIRRYSLASVAGVSTEDDDSETNRVEKSGGALSNVKVMHNENFKPQTTSAPKTKTPLPNAGEFVAPFGDAKGTLLTELPIKSNDRTKKCADLNYWANAWQPKPFGDSGVVSKRDLALKAEAQRLWAISLGEGKPSEEDFETKSADEIPF